MDPVLVNFIVSLTSGVAAGLSTDAIRAAIKKVFSSRPELEEQISNPASAASFESALGEIAGELEALAGTGSISIDGAAIEALRSARFDHQSGQVQIGNAVISAPFLQTGGSGSGQTVIGGNTELRSAGTAIKIGEGAGIVISGNAGIKQSQAL